MDRERVDAWLEAYRQAWEEADARAIPGMFSQEATYRAHPLGIAYTGHDAIAVYWTRATAGQRDIQVRFGDPIVDGDRVAAEFWTTMRSDGGPVTVAGCLLLALAPDGGCRSSASAGTRPGRSWPRRPTGAAWARPRAWTPAAPAPTTAAAGPRGTNASGRPASPRPRRRCTPPTPTTAPRRSATRTWVATASSPTPAAPTPPRPPRTPASAPRSRRGPVPRPRSSGGPTMREEGQPATLIGCSFLTFTADGLVASGRDYWFLEPGTHAPYDGGGG